ncbi:MAG: hypothetical protein DRI44_06995 [Chlamydiae bacterium]|nr:MAG: hypothetical protein DRI44_06995 [Chlamydiota bacterium]
MKINFQNLNQKKKKDFVEMIIMKNIRLTAIVIITVISVIIISVYLKHNGNEPPFSIEELKQLVEQYGENSPLVAEYLDKYKNSEELKDEIIKLRKNDDSKYYGSNNKFGKNSLRGNKQNKNKEQTKGGQIALNKNNPLYSDNSNNIDPSENSTDKSEQNNFSTNSSDNLQALQQILDNLPARSNDFLVKLDKNATGLELNITGREASVSADMLNSDLFENGAFSNAPGIWVTGLDKSKDSLTYEALWQDYKNRFIEIPGVGIYLMKDKLSDKAFAERKIEILNELINEKPNDNLYEQLAKTYAESGDLATAEKTINTWAEKSDRVNYEYEMAEIYRLNGEKSNNEDYLQKAADYYEQANKSPESARKTALPLAKTYEKLGDLNSAIRTLENSYDYGKTKKWKDDVAVQLGNYYSKTGDDYAALNWYETSPKPGFINKVRSAEAYERLGDTQSAIKYYEESIKYNRNDKYNPMISLGLIYSRNGNNEKAKEMIRKIDNHLQKLPQKRRRLIKNTPDYKKLRNQ